MPHPANVYLDNNATTAVDPRVAREISEAFSQFHGNPASQHRFGAEARRVVELAREQIALWLGASVDSHPADRLVFTSGGTESNNLAMHGLGGTLESGAVIISSLEHPSVSTACDELARRGADVRRVRANLNGRVDLNHLDELLRRKPVRLVSVMAANNETGVIQPVSDIADQCDQAGVPFHCDAVQWIGKQPLHFRAGRFAAVSFSAHKLHGPRGIGGLIIRSDTSLQPFLSGGSQQLGLRPGTEPVELILGMKTAVELATSEWEARSIRMARLRDRLESSLKAQLDDLVVIGSDALRVPHTSCLAFAGVDRQAAVMALDLAGVACSTGSACASGSSEPSPALLAMGLPSSVVGSAVRFSLSALTTELEIDTAVERITRIINDLRRSQRRR